MAVAYQSVSTTAFAGISDGANMNVTKPSGTVDGDLLVAHLVVTTRDGDAHNFTLPAGWTGIIDEHNGDRNQQVAYKVASSEGASYNFTHIDPSGADDGFCAGAIYRISGQGDVSSIQYATASDSSAGGFSFSNTVTPNFADSLLLFLVEADETTTNTTGSASGYAITTNNPTWTERYDQTGSMDAHFGAGNPTGTVMAGATASRPEVTATGNSSVSLSNMEDCIASIIVIPPVTGTSVSPSVLSVVSSVQEPTVSGGATVTPVVITTTTTIQSPTITTPAPTVLNVDKNSATWVNQDKS